MPCVDLDDVARDTITSNQTYNDILHERILSLSNKFVVLVGFWTLKSVNVIEKILLKPTNIKNTYRNYLRRNLENIVKYTDEIKNIIDTIEVNKITYDISHKLMINANLTLPFKYYKMGLDENTKEHIKDGFKIMTQKTADSYILKLHSSIPILIQ